MYYPFSASCASQFQCTESGWGVLQLAVLATVGYRDEAAARVALLPDESFTNAAGNGHSRTNSLWYIATRPQIQSPIPMVQSDLRGADEKRPAPVFELIDCHTPATCTEEILDRMAGTFSCRDRMAWLIQEQRTSQWDACSLVAGIEYPESCGPCDPSNEVHNDHNETAQVSQETTDIVEAECPSCTEDECYSQLNRCPLFDNTVRVRRFSLVESFQRFSRSHLCIYMSTVCLHKRTKCIWLQLETMGRRIGMRSLLRNDLMSEPQG